jgi:hypothetical protein
VDSVPSGCHTSVSGWKAGDVVGDPDAVPVELVHDAAA